MIKIKDYIFNGNEIKMFIDGERIKVVFKNDTHIYIDANYEDIEWNYEDKQIRKCLDSIDREKELEEKNKTFEDYNKDLNNQIDKLEEENKMYKVAVDGWKKDYAELEEENKTLKEQLHQASLDIQELTEKDIGCPSWCDKLTNLQEENKKLQKRSKILENNNNLLINQKQQMYDELDKFSNRFDKAIEYIEETSPFIGKETLKKILIGEE